MVSLSESKSEVNFDDVVLSTNSVNIHSIRGDTVCNHVSIDDE